MAAQAKAPTIGDRVRGIRVQSRLRQADLAGLLGLSPAAYARRESDEVQFKATEIATLARRFGVPSASLLCEEAAK